MERIICAAIWWKEFPTAHLLPTNITNGVVIGGHRHPHCIYAMNALMKTRQCEQGEQEQGFLTDKNRFVDRKEALIIALAANQYLPTRVRGVSLYSEDIY